MRILEHRVFRGPNLYALYPVIRLRIDLGELEDYPTTALPGFVDRLLGLIPTLNEHTCSEGDVGGLVRRMTEGRGTWLGHVMEHIALELQCLAGTRVSYGKTRQHHLPRGQYFVIYEVADEAVGLKAGELALRLVRGLLPPDRTAFDPTPLAFQQEVDQLAQLANDQALGPSTAALVRAAEERDIPWMRLDKFSLIQLGHGKFQKRLAATTTSESRQIAVDIACDKAQTNKLLSELGLPVPAQRLVRDDIEALNAAHELGFPVVVKPLDANHGKGVSVGIGNDEQVKEAFALAAEYRNLVLVEKCVTGQDHRILVIDGKTVACAQRIPGFVTGDGQKTVLELVTTLNTDPRRGVGHEKILTKIEMDEQAQRLMALAGVTGETILPLGKELFLRSTGNLSTGGTAVDMTDVLHYDNRIMAERAVRAIGLDVGGVDFLTPDISRSWREVGGAIVEVNAAPGFRMHLMPSEGRPRDVAKPVVDMLFPQGTLSRVPIAAITGTNGKTTTARMVAHMMQLAGYTVGLTTTDGVFINGELLVAGDCTGPWSARQVLRDPTVDCAVLETARGGILREGLGWNWCNVGAILNVREDHLGIGGITTLADLAEVKHILAEVARDYVVLNADDPLVAEMHSVSRAEPIFFTADPRNQLVREHVHNGGRAFVLEEGVNGDSLAYYHGEKHTQVLWAHLIPATLEGFAHFNILNALAAAAIATGLGVPLTTIRQGLRTFDTTYFQTPGRLNVFNELPFRVILDYAHNAPAMQEMANLISSLPVVGRRIGVVSAPGDRRDADIRDLGAIAGRVFDSLILREDDDLRGRPEGETMKLLTEGAVSAGMAEAEITAIREEPKAIECGLHLAHTGDLLVIFADQVARSWKQVIYFGKENTKVLPSGAQPDQRSSIPPLFRDFDRTLVAKRARRGED